MSSSLSFKRGNAGLNASGNRRNTLYIISTAFFLKYGFVDDNYNKNIIFTLHYKYLLKYRLVTNVIMSLAKSLAKSGLIKQASAERATPASY